MHAPAAALLLTLSPTPSDLAAARADLFAPPDAPAFLTPGPRQRVAMLAEMHAAGVLDGDQDFRWFAPVYPWASELSCARGLVARLGPPVEDRYPPAAWFRWQAGELAALAADYRKQAEEHRERVIWEDDRAEALHDRARQFDAEAERLGCLAATYDGWAGNSWSRPRRIVVQELAAAGW